MRFFIKVKTGAKVESVKQIDETHFVVAVSARPEKGRANEAVCKALAEYLKIPLWRVGIRSGLTSKEKIIEITP
ncbi:MAG TPA: DUF167 domain-containing protein [Candidatus Paceibacterota bacterium]